MTLLELALDAAVADAVQDHWLVAHALAGRAAETPRDAELAELVLFVRTTGSADLADLLELQPEAIRRHLDWVLDSSAWCLPSPPPSLVASSHLAVAA